jgi:predicted transposase/invertase (TIGR01784 family)
MDVLKRMPWILQDSVFKRLSEIAEVASLNKEERKQYDESLRHYRDTLIVMEGQYMEGEKKGRVEGLAEGEMKGRAEERIVNARKMKAKGFAIEDIADITGLTTEEIETL